ncbi:hypothetical protein [Amycolatopsis sp. cmx-4-68]|uniref:hypothetical protein n=1 Tax=Amycolatopsis sp. cmx-4-68 TaxID=2790938 RepID=UPI00397AED2E
MLAERGDFFWHRDARALDDLASDVAPGAARHQPSPLRFSEKAAGPGRGRWGPPDRGLAVARLVQAALSMWNLASFAWLPVDVPPTRYAAIVHAVAGVLDAAGVVAGSSISVDHAARDEGLNDGYDRFSAHYPWGDC